ncbi:hypothetical protein AB4865_00935 [Capnocytophaga sp. ARDL2]|uniref:DUF6922 domain-containing protein n=1 Tax=Capnocytophaga sp. ARDL2 TaxID=3238809 RepID=UPI003556E58C
MFWDTDISQIDSELNKRAVLQRIFERGNEQEIEEIIAFYGLDQVKVVFQDFQESFLPSLKENLIKFGVI